MTRSTRKIRASAGGLGVPGRLARGLAGVMVAGLVACYDDTKLFGTDQPTTISNPGEYKELRAT